MMGRTHAVEYLLQVRFAEIGASEHSPILFEVEEAVKVSVGAVLEADSDAYTEAGKEIADRIRLLSGC